MKISDTAKAQKISRKTVWKLKIKYLEKGDIAFEDNKGGRPFESLNSKFHQLVVDEWKANKCGARKLHAVIKRKGFTVSRRKIEQVLVKEGFQNPNLKKRKPRSYKRYEWPIPNYMWHTDWHVIKAEKLKGRNILVYIDDCSRKVMSYALGAMTTQNSLFALYSAIANNEVIPYCLNSDRGTQFFPNKRDKKGNASHKFQLELEFLGIHFIPSKARHPQTNGKNEKFFDILDKEFDERFETIDDFINWYNNERLSEALNYLTPNEAYKKRL